MPQFTQYNGDMMKLIPFVISSLLLLRISIPKKYVITSWLSLDTYYQMFLESKEIRNIVCIVDQLSFIIALQLRQYLGDFDAKIQFYLNIVLVTYIVICPYRYKSA